MALLRIDRRTAVYLIKQTRATAYSKYDQNEKTDGKAEQLTIRCPTRHAGRQRGATILAAPNVHPYR